MRFYRCCSIATSPPIFVPDLQPYGARFDIDFPPPGLDLNKKRPGAPVTGLTRMRRTYRSTTLVQAKGTRRGFMRYIRGRSRCAEVQGYQKCDLRCPVHRIEFLDRHARLGSLQSRYVKSSKCECHSICSSQISAVHSRFACALCRKYRGTSIHDRRYELGTELAPMVAHTIRPGISRPE